jgi:hypothetical protein
MPLYPSRRSGIAPSSITVTPGAAVRWPKFRKHRSLLLVEITFQPVADSLVQQHVGPAGTDGGRDMGKVTRKRQSAESKASVTLEAIKGEQTLAEIGAKHDVHLTLVAA